jgi:hypothetical protein
VLAIAASDFASGRGFLSEDTDRIALAAGRIRNAWSTYRGH